MMGMECVLIDRYPGGGHDVWPRWLEPQSERPLQHSRWDSESRNPTNSRMGGTACRPSLPRALAIGLMAQTADSQRIRYGILYASRLRCGKTQPLGGAVAEPSPPGAPRRSSSASPTSHRSVPSPSRVPAAAPTIHVLMSSAGDFHAHISFLSRASRPRHCPGPPWLVVTWLDSIRTRATNYPRVYRCMSAWVLPPRSPSAF